MTSFPKRSIALSMIPLLIAVAGPIGFGSAAEAQDPAKSFTFEYDRAELNSPEAARKMLHRLSIETRDACKIPGVTALFKPSAQKDCEADIVARVVAGIGSPFLTAAFDRPAEAASGRRGAYADGGGALFWWMIMIFCQILRDRLVVKSSISLTA